MNIKNEVPGFLTNSSPAVSSFSTGNRIVSNFQPSDSMFFEVLGVLECDETKTKKYTEKISLYYVFAFDHPYNDENCICFLSIVPRYWAVRTIRIV